MDRDDRSRDGNVTRLCFAQKAPERVNTSAYLDLADRGVANALDSVADHHSPKERQPTPMPKLPYHQPDQSYK